MVVVLSVCSKKGVFPIQSGRSERPLDIQPKWQVSILTILDVTFSPILVCIKSHPKQKLSLIIGLNFLFSAAIYSSPIY